MMCSLVCKLSNTCLELITALSAIALYYVRMHQVDRRGLHQNYFISRENGTYSVKSIRILTISVIKIIPQFNQLAEHRSNLLAMSTKLYVGNLPDSAKDKDLRELFQAFGEVDEVAVLRGYGFVVSQPSFFFFR